MIVFGLNGVTAKKVSPSPNMNLPSTVKLDDSQTGRATALLQLNTEK